METNFFVCSVGDPNEGYDVENFERSIKYTGHFMHKATKQKGAFDDVKNGDVIILRYKNRLNAYGEVMRKSTEENEQLGDWNYAIYVKEWFFHDISDKSKGISRYGVQDATIKGAQFSTIKQIEENFAIDKMTVINNDNELLHRILEQKNNF